jgi:hypothetical protein
MRPVAAPLSLLLLLPACADGGKSESPQSEVKIIAEHHFVGMLGRPAFAAFPVAPGETQALVGRLSMSDDSRYSLRSGTTVLVTDSYALEKNGELALLVAQTRAPTHVYRGAYGLEDDSGHLFFTDRVGQAIGLYFGTRAVQGQPDPKALAGKWHLLSQHVMFAAAGTLPATSAVGRAFAGSVELAEDGRIAGTGVESTNTQATLSVGGDPAGGGGLKAFADGEFEVVLDYGANPTPADRRSFRGGGTGSLILTADHATDDGAAGLMVMMRHRDQAVDLSQLAGRYVAGVWTVFAKPTASGFDSAIGTLELTSSGVFRLVATNNEGEQFTYSGRFTASTTDLGALTFDVDGTKETWHGAVDAAHSTLCVVDPFVEKRADNQVELNLVFAIRPVPQTN